MEKSTDQRELANLRRLAALTGLRLPISDEELRRYWARLTREEQETFMRLLAKAAGEVS